MSRVIKLFKLIDGYPGLWFARCQACKGERSYMIHPVHQLVLMWAFSHLKRYHDA